MAVLGGNGPEGIDGPEGGVTEGTDDGKGEVRKDGSADGGATFVRTERPDVDGSET